MTNRQPAERFGRTQRPLAVVLLLMAFLSLLLPYIVVHIPRVLPMKGTELSSIWLPLFFIPVSCICLLIGKTRGAAVAACCSAVVACISLYFVYREIQFIGFIFSPAIPGFNFRNVSAPGIGFALLTGCSIVLLFVSMLAVRYSPPPRKPLEENELIDDIPETDG